jgi:hypothetical protein
VIKGLVEVFRTIIKPYSESKLFLLAFKRSLKIKSKVFGVSKSWPVFKFNLRAEFWIVKTIKAGVI